MLQLVNFFGLLYHLDPVGLSLRHDRDVNDLLGELQRWNIDVLGHLVDLPLDDVFLHFDCVDDVLNVRVLTLVRPSLRLNDRYLKDRPNEKTVGGSMVCSAELC